MYVCMYEIEIYLPGIPGSGDTGIQVLSTLRFPWLKAVPTDGDTGAKEPPHVLVSAPGRSVRFLAASVLASAALAARTEGGRSPMGVTRTRTLLSHLIGKC